MIDMLQNAKDLIAKGKALDDPDLIQMGIELLQQYSPSEMSEAVEENGGFREVSAALEPHYVCENCGHKMTIDKDRKRCPECKKHQLRTVMPTPPQPKKAVAKKPARYADNDEFYRPVRAPGKDRVYYDDEGNPIGRYTRPEAFNPDTVQNVFQDDGEFKDDPTNEKLKAITRVSPRTRKPATKVDAKCENCGKIDKIHPLHIANSSRYLCNRCIGRRSQF